MIGSLGFPEILMILVLALLIFGPRRLPQIGQTLGRALGEFRRATYDLRHSLETEASLEERSSGPSEAPASSGPEEASPGSGSAAEEKGARVTGADASGGSVAPGPGATVARSGGDGGG